MLRTLMAFLWTLVLACGLIGLTGCGGGGGSAQEAEPYTDETLEELYGPLDREESN